MDTLTVPPVTFWPAGTYRYIIYSCKYTPSYMHQFLFITLERRQHFNSMIHLTELDFSVDSERLAPRQRAGVDLDVRDLQGISRFACSRYKCLRRCSWTSIKSSTLTAVAPDTIRLVLVVHGTSLLHRRRRIKTVPADCIRRTLQRHRPELH